MDFSAIKTLIEQNIRTNNNEDITGSVLQNVLLGIIETLGDDAINDLITALGQEVNNRQNAVQGEADARVAAINNVLGLLRDEVQARQDADAAEHQRAEAAFDDLDMIDAAGVDVRQESIDLTLRKNDGSDEDPDWRTLCSILLPSVSYDRAGLMSVDLRNKLLYLMNGGYLFQGVAVPASNPGTPHASCFYLATKSGTYTNFHNADDDPIVIEHDAIYVFTYDAVENSYWEWNKVTDIGDGVFDISMYNLTEGLPTAYTDLSAALGTNGANVPAAFRKGGMSIKFVHTSDNKYVQYRYMGTSTAVADFTNVANWQGVDDEPTAGSENLVKSGGVARMDTIGTKYTNNSSGSFIFPYPFKAGKKYVLEYTGKIVSCYTSNANNWSEARVDTVSGMVGSKKTIEFIPSANANYMTYWANTEGTFIIYVPTNETDRLRTEIAEAEDRCVNPEKLNQYVYVGAYKNGTVNNSSNTSYVRFIDIIPIIGVGISNCFVENYALTDGHKYVYTFITYDKDMNIVRNMSTPTSTFPLYFKPNEVYIGFDFTEYDAQDNDLRLQSILNLSTTYKLGVNFISYVADLNLLHDIANDKFIYFSDSKKPIFGINENVISVTFPAGFFRIYDAAYNSLYGNVQVAESTEYTIPVLSRLVFNKSTKAISVVASTNHDDFITLLYNNGGAVSGLLLPYFVNEISRDLTFISYNIAEHQISQIQILNGWSDVHSFQFRKGTKYKLVFSDYQASFWTLTTSTHQTSARVDNIASILAETPVVFTPTADADYCEGWNACTLTITVLSMGNRLNQLESDVAEISAEIGTEITSMYPERKYLPKIGALKKGTPYGWGTTQNTPLVFLLFTDIHGDINNVKRIVEWKTKYADYIDDILNAGDTVTDSNGNYNSVMPSYFSEGGDKMLMALGNHDVCYNGNYKGWDGRSGFTIQDVFDKFTGLMDSLALDIVFPTSAEIGAIADYANFYYKDYTDGVINSKPVRLFVLDSCITVESIIASGSGNPTTDTQAYQDAQLSWFTSKLADAKTLGYAVVVMCHCAPACTEFESDSAFTIYPTSLAISHDNQASIPVGFVNAVDTFISGNDGGEFVCWLVGHTHANHIAKITGHTNQVVIGFNTATSRSYRASPTDPYRTGYNGTVPITETTDAFCMVEIDTYYKVVRLLNVGTDYDMYGRKKDMIVVDYANKQILGF